jgi:hypothetical protein
LLDWVKDAPVEREEMSDKDFKEFVFDHIVEMKNSNNTIITEMRELLKALVNDKTTSQDDLEKKELVQSAVRSLNEALRSYKKR